MYNVSIPKISREELLERYEHIKPIVEIDGKKYFLREFTEKELTNISYIAHVQQNKRDEVDMNKYIPLADMDFECIHSYGYPGFFKPSIAEVLAQLNKHDLGIISAFEIIEAPETAEDFYKNKNAFNNGFHVSTVRLYYKKD